MRRLTPLLLFLLASFGHAQQGAAGYGQGGGGGGGSGMAGGMPGSFGEDAAANKSHPEDEGDSQIWQTRTAILTPGDKVEYKLLVKKGESLFAGATSDAFDPALSVVDPKGKEIAKNDDREEGDQSPFVAVRFPEDGTYLLRVVSYKSAAGGKFTLRMRTFTAFDAKLGPATAEVGRDEDGNRRLVFRLAAEKNAVYDLRPVRGVGQEGGYGSSVYRVVGPTGVGTSDVETIPVSSGGLVVRTKVAGDYYLEYALGGVSRVATDFRKVEVVGIKGTGETTFGLDPQEVKVVEFPVASDAIVRTTLVARAVTSRLSAPASSRVRGSVEDPTYGNTPNFAYFLLNRDSEDDVVRIFHAEGTARMAIRSNDPKAQSVTVRNSETLPDWEAGKPVNGVLGIGDIRLFRMRSSKSELMKVFAKSPSFQVRLDIFRMNGERANTLMNRATRTAADDLYFPDADEFLVRLSCDGYGGSGEYTLRRDVPATEPYALGEARTLTLDGSNFGLYAMELQAGTRYELVTDAPDSFLRVDLLDEDGQFLRSQAVRLDGVIVQYFVPTRSGKHRLWLRGEAATHRFTFRPNVPPKVGG